MTTIGKEMLVNVKDDMVAFVIDSLTKEIAYKLEQYIIGKVISGVNAGNVITYSSLDAVDYADILGLEALLSVYNLNDIKAYMTPSTRAVLKGIEKAQNTAKFLIEDGKL